MKLLTNDKTYEGVTFRPTADGCVITAREAIEPGGVLVIQADDGAELCRYTVADWLRCETDGGTLTLSNSPAPEPPPAPASFSELHISCRNTENNANCAHKPRKSRILALDL